MHRHAQQVHTCTYACIHPHMCTHMPPCFNPMVHSRDLPGKEAGPAVPCSMVPFHGEASTLSTRWGRASHWSDRTRAVQPEQRSSGWASGAGTVYTPHIPITTWRVSILPFFQDDLLPLSASPNPILHLGRLLLEASPGWKPFSVPQNSLGTSPRAPQCPEHLEWSGPPPAF